MIQGIGFLGFDSWVCIHWFLGLNIINILGTLKILFLSVPYLPSICINNRKWVQIPGFGFLGLDSCVWIPAFGFLGLDSWVWIPGFGVLGLDSWIWTPGLDLDLDLDSWAWILEIGVLSLDSWILTPGKNITGNPIKTLSFLTEFANPEVPPTIHPNIVGGPGPETRLKKESLYKLARALQITLPRWSGLEEIPLILDTLDCLSKNPSR